MEKCLNKECICEFEISVIETEGAKIKIDGPGGYIFIATEQVDAIARVLTLVKNVAQHKLTKEKKECRDQKKSDLDDEKIDLMDSVREIRNQLNVMESLFKIAEGHIKD